MLSFLFFVSSCGEISYFQVIRHKSEKTTEVIYITTNLKQYNYKRHLLESDIFYEFSAFFKIRRTT